MRERSFRALVAGLVVLAPALGGADGGCGPGLVPIGRDPGAAGSASGAPSEDCAPGTCEDAECSDEAGAIRELLAAHGRCVSDADCTTVNVSCLPSENCTGNFYVNEQLDRRLLAELTRELDTCVNGQAEQGCPVCDRFDPPPVCIEGTCRGSDGSEPPRPENPCSGKACGEECSTCVPGEPCLAILQVCDGAGQCGGSVACRDPGDACAGKTCGDECSTCAPGEPCLAILEFCDANGACGRAMPECR